jgi:hypothetical protein
VWGSALHKSGQLHAPTALPCRKISRFKLNRRLCGLQSRYGRCGDKVLPSPVIEPRFIGRPPDEISTLLTFFPLCFTHGRSRYSDGLPSGRPGFDSRQCKIFLFSTASRPALGPYPMGTGGGGGIFPRVTRPGPEADHFHLVLRPRMVELYLHSPICLHGIVLN